MLAAAERGGDRASQCAAHTRLGENLIWCAHFVEAQKHLELGSRYYDEADRSELGLMGFDAPALAAVTVLLLGFPDRASQLMNEALRRLEGREDPLWVGIVHMWGGMLSVLLRNAPATLEHAQALRRLANKEPVWTGVADANMARALMLLGNRAEGIIYLRKAIAFSKSVGLIAHLMRAKLDEIEFFTKEGRINDGLALVAEALRDSEELAQIRAPVLRYRADLLALSGADTPEVEAAYRSAIECAREQGARYYELQTTTSFARWLKAQRRAVEAHTLLAEIYGWFTEGFDAPALKEAKALLDDLNDNSTAGSRRKRQRSPD
jgi:tetratricopeptide (TPR) repeat protein